MPPPLTPPSYLEKPSAPKLKLPPQACDSHFHVFGPQSRFPFPENRAFTPSDAPKEKMFALHRFLGVARGVVVQSTCHQFENAVVEDAIADRPGQYRGIVLLPLSVEDKELLRLNQRGICGVRFNYFGHLGGAPAIADVIAFAARLAPLGWHLQIHPSPDVFPDLVPHLRRSPVPVVIDHMARIDASRGLEQPAFRALLEVMRDARFWVKVSGCERASKQAYPYADALPFAQKLVQEFGDRVLWGTDWPHPNPPPSGISDDGKLVDLIQEIAPAEAQRQALLVDNPQRLYQFTA